MSLELKLGRVEEGLDGDALVVMCHWFSRVDVDVAGDTEGGGVTLAHEGILTKSKAKITRVAISVKEDGII
jgi:hypothetical protein